MKNLFKNLMLVAVAAMAFTACQKDNDETNKTEQKTVITGVATIANDDTRSCFLPKEEGETAYQSAWDGGETIKLFIEGVSEPVTTTIDVNGHFSVEVDGTLPESYFMTVCSPAEAWSSLSSNTIPAEQTPRANSVDPLAHILQKQQAYVTNGSVEVQMGHQVAYAKMTVNTPAEFVIDYVEVEFNGSWYGFDKGVLYTINADKVENNVFWFATDVMHVTDFTVTAYDENGNAYTKSRDNLTEGQLTFQFGHVSTFSVSNLTIKESTGEDDVNKFTSATAEFIDANWPKLTFVDNHSNILTFRIGNGSVNYWNPGIWSSNNFYSSGFAVDSATYNGANISNLNATVNIDADKYSVVFSWGGGKGSFNGLIYGLKIPGGSDEDDSDAPSEIAFTDAKVNPMDGYSQIYLYDGTVPVFFSEFNHANISADNKIVAGKYTYDSGSSYPNFSVTGTTWNDIAANSATVIVDDKGNGTYTFTVTCTVGTNEYRGTYTGVLNNK